MLPQHWETHDQSGYPVNRRTERSNGNNGNHDRVAVVTGSSRGIGKAIAREFVQNGYCVVLNSRDEEDLNRAAQDIAKGIRNDQRIQYVAGDVSQENIYRSLIRAAIKKFGRLDVLVTTGAAYRFITFRIKNDCFTIVTSLHTPTFVHDNSIGSISFWYVSPSTGENITELTDLLPELPIDVFFKIYSMNH